MAFENIENNLSEVIACGTIESYDPDYRVAGVLVYSTNGGENFNEYQNFITGNHYSYETITKLPGNNDEFRMIGWQQQPINRSYCWFMNGHQVTSSHIIGDDWWEPNGHAPSNGLAFSNFNLGFVVGTWGPYAITTNSGQNWYSGGWYNENFPGWYVYDQSLHQLQVINDVMYAASIPTIYYSRFCTREISENLNTNYDWQMNNSGSFVIDNLDGNGPQTYYTSTHPNVYFRGGTSVQSLGHNRFDIFGQDTTAQFYYWGGLSNSSMNSENNVMYFDKVGQLNADYKTQLRSNTVEAIRFAPQTKAIKDSIKNGIGGYVNLVYESMGGIFFTRTRASDGNFKCEEIISGTSNAPNDGYATFQNSNPFLAEIRSMSSSGNSVNSEENMVVIWERREGNDIKIYKADRWYNTLTQTFGWAKELLATISNAPAGFKCFPKIVQATTEGSTYIDKGIFTFLQPEANGNKSIQGSYFTDAGGGVTHTLVSAGNISDYSVAFVYGLNGIFDLHLAYTLVPANSNVNSIKYRHCQYDANYSYTWNNSLGNEDKTINDIEVQNYRYSPDISLKNASSNPAIINMQPVIAYQGQYRARVIIGGINTNSMDIYYYPIIIRERNTDGTWASQNIQYNSAVQQQFPNIEGSKTRNSYIVNYSQGNTYFQRLPRWEGSITSGYYCSPASYPVSDAKFVRGGLVNQSSTSQNLITLSPENSIYKLEKQPSTITNTRQVGDGAFDGVQGIIVVDNMKYSFNLGSIMVNSNMVDFTPQLDSNYNNINQLNSSMRSNNFLLNTNDTLILGRNAFYLQGDSAGTFQGIEYWVDLYTSRNILHSTLIHDTLHVNDTVQLEYLDGFVISNIRNGSDSFYVQLRIDTVHASSIGGGDISDGDGPTGLGNKLGIQKKIFWHDGRTEKENTIPTVFNLYQNYPNPFNPSTTIKYDLPKDVNVTIKVYDLLGKEVTRLVNNEFKKAGSYSVQWNALNFASGLYICRIQAGDYVNVKKMVLVK